MQGPPSQIGIDPEQGPQLSPHEAHAQRPRLNNQRQSQQQPETAKQAHVLGLALSMGHSTVQVRTSTMNTVVRLM